MNGDLRKVYHKLFDKSLGKYNANQKLKDRQIKNYYDKIARSRQRECENIETVVEIRQERVEFLGSDIDRKRRVIRQKQEVAEKT